MKKKQIIRIVISIFVFCISPLYLFSQFNITSTITNASCPSSANGSISVSVSGENKPYTYQWVEVFQTSPSATGLAAGDYSLVVTDSLGIDSTVVFSVGSELNCEISPEPFFTPNGDGYNDTWYIANAQYFDNIHLIVFDRWGTRVHEQKGTYESWDGKSYLGIPVPVSVYYYFFYKDKNDKQQEAIHGSVTIMR